MKFLLLVTSILLPALTFAHSGRTNGSGCHAGSQPYHCHNSGHGRYEGYAPKRGYVQPQMPVHESSYNADGSRKITQSFSYNIDSAKERLEKSYATSASKKVKPSYTPYKRNFTGYAARNKAKADTIEIYKVIDQDTIQIVIGSKFYTVNIAPARKLWEQSH